MEPAPSTKKKLYERLQSARKAKKEKKNLRASLLRRNLNIEKNTAKFNEYTKTHSIHHTEIMPTSCFYRVVRTPEGFLKLLSPPNQCQSMSLSARGRSRTTSAVMDIEKMDGNLYIQLPKFDFQKVVKINRLRKEFHETERIRRLKRKGLKKDVKTPVKFTIKILNPVNS